MTPQELDTIRARALHPLKSPSVRHLATLYDDLRSLIGFIDELKAQGAAHIAVEEERNLLSEKIKRIEELLDDAPIGNILMGPVVPVRQLTEALADPKN